jgi:hypothetical protein
MTYEQYMDVWKVVRPLYQKRGLVPTLAAKLATDQKTIRNYHNKYGWPLYESAEDVE